MAPSMLNKVWTEINKRKDKNEFLNRFRAKLKNHELSTEAVLVSEMQSVNQQLSHLGHQTEMLNAEKLAIMALLDKRRQHKHDADNLHNESVERVAVARKVRT